MSDLFSDKERSEIMRAVKAKGNKSTELRLIQIFKTNKITGWRRNYKLPGRPDFVFLRQRVAVFADGCFWHGHNCRNTRPRDHAEYWRKKVGGNRKRDVKVSKLLTLKGWKVVRIWECQIKREKVTRLLKVLSSNQGTRR